MTTRTHRYVPVHHGRDVSHGVAVSDWLTLEVPHTGEIVGLHVYDDHSDAEAYEAVVHGVRIDESVRDRDAADDGTRYTLAEVADELGVDLDEL